MKMPQRFALFILAVLAAIPLSSFGETRPDPATAAVSDDGGARDRQKPGEPNPIVLDGQIREVGRDGDAYVLWLIRQKWPVVAWSSTHVRRSDGASCDVSDLRPRDVVHVTGNLEYLGGWWDDSGTYSHYRITADRIVVQLRVEHRP